MGLVASVEVDTSEKLSPVRGVAGNHVNAAWGTPLRLYRAAGVAGEGAAAPGAGTHTRTLNKNATTVAPNGFARILLTVSRPVYVTPQSASKPGTSGRRRGSASGASLEGKVSPAHAQLESYLRDHDVTVEL